MSIPRYSDAVGIGQGVASPEKHTTAEEALTPPSPPKFRSRFERRRQAEYSARHREKHADTPLMRVVDRTLVEALGTHLVALPPDVVKALVPVLVDLAVDGLVLAGYDRKAARRSVGKRLQYWMSSKPRGTVKLARARAAVAEAISVPNTATPATPTLFAQRAQDQQLPHNGSTQMPESR